ncbi:lipoyl protein ligase domain-containing protein [Hyphomonas jannaschiana]|uniref:Biotin/lipoate A/B protein ligase family n=1 Tax=Hyphomonas jannaschiana VP2 TaxID=1280952 RepID=A0A059FH49_9PROT|nr:hypothetical protein [Hyphomonas jannaschiana]KCZ89833.1 biotin/lipoate A/B protein ligase family [Hyphomonas jannaschiana VP2]
MQFEAVANEGKPQAQLYFWQQSQCLVVPRAYSRHTGIDAAMAAAGDLGWSVLFRASGGSCVFHGRQVLCVTRLICEPRGTSGIDAHYRSFTASLSGAAERLGVTGVRTGAAPDAPCDGRFNLLAGDRKLAGTAMRRRSRAGMDTTLAHACLWLNGPLAPSLHAVEVFETHLGTHKAYPESACITLEEATGRAGEDPAALANDWVSAMMADADPTCSASV